MKKIFLPIILLISLSVLAQNEAPSATNVSTSGTLTVTTTTATAGGKHSPNNYIAIWVQNGTTFVKTLCQFGQNSSYITDLSAWVANSAKNKVGLVSTGVDATTGATLKSYGSRTCKWDGTNVSSVVQADGTYTIKFELVDTEGGVAVGATGHKVATYTFVKGPANSSGTLSGAAASCFSNVTISWVPVPPPAAINDVELEKMYNVYPNPAISSIYVTGTDIKDIEICSLTGRSIFTSKEQNVNVSALPKGMYLAVIRSKAGTIVKKIEKR